MNTLFALQKKARHKQDKHNSVNEYKACFSIVNSNWKIFFRFLVYKMTHQLTCCTFSKYFGNHVYDLLLCILPFKAKSSVLMVAGPSKKQFHWLAHHLFTLFVKQNQFFLGGSGGSVHNSIAIVNKEYGSNTAVWK